MIVALPIGVFGPRKVKSDRASQVWKHIKSGETSILKSVCNMYVLIASWLFLDNEIKNYKNAFKNPWQIQSKPDLY